MNNGKHIGITSAVKRQLKGVVDKHGLDAVASRIEVSRNSIRGYLDGSTKRWRSGTRDKVLYLSIEKVEVIVQSISTVRRLYNILKAEDVSSEVLGLVACFILENE